MTDKEYPYEVAATDAPATAVSPDSGRASAANGAHGPEPEPTAAAWRVRFHSKVKVKHMRGLRISQFDLANASVGDIVDVLSVWLAGVNEQDFATPAEAIAFMDELDTMGDLMKLAQAFTEFREGVQVPPTSGGG